MEVPEIKEGTIIILDGEIVRITDIEETEYKNQVKINYDVLGGVY